MAELADELNALATTALLDQNPSLPGGTEAHIIDAGSTTPLQFTVQGKTHKSNFALDTQAQVKAHSAQIDYKYAPGPATTVGITLALPQPDHRGITAGVAYYTDATTAYLNLMAVYDNSYSSKQTSVMFNTVTAMTYPVVAPDSVAHVLSSYAIQPQAYWSHTHADRTYHTVKVPDGLYDVTSLSTALATEVAHLALVEPAFAAKQFTFSPDFTKNRVVATIKNAGDQILFTCQLAVR